MLLRIKGLDVFTSDVNEPFNIVVDLMTNDLNIIHEEDCVKVYVDSDEYFVSIREHFKVNV